ncbi:hypothetical protein EDD16DRAFT_1627461 [Pisolithus croceorrhizus]|nr:hypothetical protein EDD16DRAFT_1627461 [Pisolithus croceorrhizus]
MSQRELRLEMISLALDVAHHFREPRRVVLGKRWRRGVCQLHHGGLEGRRRRWRKTSRFSWNFVDRFSAGLWYPVTIVWGRGEILQGPLVGAKVLLPYGRFVLFLMWFWFGTRGGGPGCRAWGFPTRRTVRDR